MAQTSVFDLIAGTTLATADVLPFVDVSDTTQSAQGSLLKITVANFFATIPTATTITSTTNPQFKVAYDGSNHVVVRVTSTGVCQFTSTGSGSGYQFNGTNGVEVKSATGSALLDINAFTASDPLLRWYINGSLQWTARVANASGEWILSVPGGNRFSMTTGGNLTLVGSIAGVTTLQTSSYALVGTSVTTSVGVGDVAVANAKYFRGVNALGTDTLRLIGLSSGNKVTIDPDGQGSTFAAQISVTGAAASVGANTVSYGGTTQSTVGAAGGASALPATPTGYIIVNVAGTNRVIPYYAAS